MSNLGKKVLNRTLRAARVRAKVTGTTQRPRLTVTISNKHVSAQVIDDVTHNTIVAATTIGTKQLGSIADQAALIGAEIGKKAKKAKITTVVFDRNGRLYAKRLAALADAARKEGLVF